MRVFRWDTIYPIYVDNKHPQQDGARRVSKSVGLEWPLAEPIARVCRMMGLETVYEVRTLSSRNLGKKKLTRKSLCSLRKLIQKIGRILVEYESSSREKMEG